MIYIFITILLLFVVFSIRFKWWKKNISYSHPRVLMYHMISNHLPKSKSKFNRLRVKPKEFEKQLKWLKKNNFKSYTLSELVSLKEIPKKSIVITFDDGYEDNFINAFPLLQKYDFKATIYIVLNRFNNNWATDKDLNIASDELNKEKMLTNKQIISMINSGFIEIASHTFDHVNLPTIADTDKIHQIEKSKEEIINLFDIGCSSFAYPFGFYDKKDVKIVEKSNYTNATTTVNGVYDITKYSKFEIPRIMVSGRQGLFAFILKIKKGRNR
ncbi:polysaccharide deacetylase family protein [Poseidonibacter ostreae]|uniref:Polysaccharide deacetylase family protein n=1 Tax=Poseidonibacter ostreae TaxID=2654171 RepID=A0A6L4WRX2_9BACT|nr:polysaccharide deacetylase family protein [Poseidonibacter ostreae]KAB7886161.1 polysaccharide deacetylase family protein [Poseidonibacter ostreae]KAB7888577.1 polysaccharide deacetylase family protein [Poseidonibacter ostreae]